MKKYKTFIYLFSLRIQGTDASEVYTRVLEDPPETLRDYLKTRGLL